MNLISKVLLALSTDVNQLVANSHFRIQRNKVKSISWQYFLLQWFGLFYWPVQSIWPFDGDNSSGFDRFKVLCSDQCGSNSRTESSFVIGWLVASDLIDKHKEEKKKRRWLTETTETPAVLEARVGGHRMQQSGQQISCHDIIWLTTPAVTSAGMIDFDCNLFCC